MDATGAITTSLERLPSGRHRLKREDVEASQRGRMVVAMANVAAEKGYGATTVADITARAAVSRRTFYEQFASKEACFIATYDLGVEYVLGQIRNAGEALPAGAGWRERIRSNLEAYLRVLAAEPGFAWTLHIEVLAAGPAALEHRARIFTVFSGRTKRLYEWARAEDPSLPELPDEAFLLQGAGVEELVRECLRTRGAAALPELAEPATRATIALFGAR